jgi:hypothetical protein
VACDQSKPLQAQAEVFDVMIGRTDALRFDLGDRSSAASWNMAAPISFVASRSHAGVQLADLIAGVAAALPTGKLGAGLADQVRGHLLADCIYPDMDFLDLGSDAAVNFMVLEELATRADERADPLEGMAEFYAAARAYLPQMLASMGRFPPQA